MVLFSSLYLLFFLVLHNFYPQVFCSCKKYTGLFVQNIILKITFNRCPIICVTVPVSRPWWIYIVIFFLKQVISIRTSFFLLFDSRCAIQCQLCIFFSLMYPWMPFKLVQLLLLVVQSVKLLLTFLWVLCLYYFSKEKKSGLKFFVYFLNVYLIIIMQSII